MKKRYTFTQVLPLVLSGAIAEAVGGPYDGMKLIKNDSGFVSWESGGSAGELVIVNAEVYSTKFVLVAAQTAIVFLPRLTPWKPTFSGQAALV